MLQLALDCSSSRNPVDPRGQVIDLSGESKRKGVGGGGEGAGRDEWKERESAGNVVTLPDRPC